MASAMLRRGVSSRTWPRVAQSAASASWVLARRSSSSFSRSGRAAPLSLTLSSLNTSCIRSGAGAVASHSRMRAARSPEVAAVKAPPVRASSCCRSWGLELAWVTEGTRVGCGKKQAVACRHRSVCQPGIFAGFQTPTKAEAGRAAQPRSAMHGRPLFHHGNTAPGVCRGGVNANAGTAQASVHRSCLAQPSDLGPAQRPTPARNIG